MSRWGKVDKIPVKDEQLQNMIDAFIFKCTVENKSKKMIINI